MVCNSSRKFVSYFPFTGLCDHSLMTIGIYGYVFYSLDYNPILLCLLLKLFQFWEFFQLASVLLWRILTDVGFWKHLCTSQCFTYVSCSSVKNQPLMSWALFPFTGEWNEEQKFGLRIFLVATKVSFLLGWQNDKICCLY